MPKGSNGQKRPGDVIGTAIVIAKIETGEIEDTATAPEKAPDDLSAARSQDFLYDEDGLPG
jgi:hypothetical protein